MSRLIEKLPPDQEELLNRLVEQAKGGSLGFRITGRDGDRAWYKHVNPTMESDGESLASFSLLEALNAAAYIELRDTAFHLTGRPSPQQQRMES